MIHGELIIIKDKQKARIKISEHQSKVEFNHEGYEKPTIDFQLEMIKLMESLLQLK